MTEVPSTYRTGGLSLGQGQAPLTAEGLTTAMTLGKLLAESGFYRDVETAAQAVVKIVKGQALGWDPIYSMSNIYVIRIGENRPPAVVLSAEGLAALIKASGRYDYQIEGWTDEGCWIQFYRIEHGKRVRIHTEAYTMADARRAHLDSKAVYQQYPKAMLFAGAMRHGFKVACPELATGCIVSGEQESEYIETDAAGTAAEPEPNTEDRLAESRRLLFGEEPAPSAPASVSPDEPEQDRPPAPAPKVDRTSFAEEVRQYLAARAAEYRADPKWGHLSDKKATEKQLDYLRTLLGKAIGDHDEDRHVLMQALTGKVHTADLVQAEASALIGWLKDPTTGDLRQGAADACSRVVAAWRVSQGQREFGEG